MPAGERVVRFVPPLVVSEAEGKSFALANDCLYATTSSKAGTGVQTAFKALAQAVLASQEHKEREQEEAKLSISLEQKVAPKGGCC